MEHRGCSKPSPERAARRRPPPHEHSSPVQPARPFSHSLIILPTSSLLLYLQNMPMEERPWPRRRSTSWRRCKRRCTSRWRGCARRWTPCKQLSRTMRKRSKKGRIRDVSACLYSVNRTAALNPLSRNTVSEQALVSHLPRSGEPPSFCLFGNMPTRTLMDSVIIDINSGYDTWEVIRALNILPEITEALDYVERGEISPLEKLDKDEFNRRLAGGDWNAYDEL